MATYSINRVAQYARYHYISQTRNYLSLILTCVAMPAFFGFLAKDISVAVDISVAIYVMGGMAFAVRTTYSMRERTMKILENTLPISNEERMTFMLFNLMVIFPLAIMLSTIVGMVIILPFNYSGMELGEAVDYMMRAYVLQWPLYVVSQIIASASLLINLLARRSLLVAYIGAFVGAITFTSILGGAGIDILINNDIAQVEAFMLPESVVNIVFIAIPIMFYALGYWALRRRQIKW